jgi:hypothetical protein
MSAQLTYYIFEGVLTGLAAGKTFHIMALSGGRGGTTTKGAESKSKTTKGLYQGTTLVVPKSVEVKRAP